jgi:subtilase family serine protease
MTHITRLRVVSAAVATGALALGALTTASATAAQAANRRSVIAGTHPAWAVTSRRVNGPASAAVAGAAVTARVYLAGRDRAGLTAYATAVSSPRSALYRHYLTPAQVMTRFGASSGQVAAVRSWLTAAGLTVIAVNDKHLAGGYIEARGSVAAASKAFAGTFGM